MILSLALIAFLPLITSQASGLRVVWNVPTSLCNKLRSGFSEELAKWGIEENTGGTFKGDKMVILYNPGSWPFVDDKGNLHNGGVPQQGDLQLHLDLFLHHLQTAIPDPRFDGLAVIDWEEWRPIWRQNWLSLNVHRNLSRTIEKEKHPLWSEENIEKAAKERFEKSALVFMSETLKRARRARPKAKWGYYGFPKCYNNSPTDVDMRCPRESMEDNDRTGWMVVESGALYPSIYLTSKGLSEAKRSKVVQNRVEECVRVAGNLPIYPYVNFRYQDTHLYMSKNDMKSSLVIAKKSGASGIIIWGSSRDVNSEENCSQLYNYLARVIGPIAQQATLS